jgi:L-seryl-tRNA(Ser) seleniumtransferase
LSANLKNIPQMGKLLGSKELSNLNEKSVKKIANKILSAIRESLKQGGEAKSEETIKKEILSEYENLKTPSIKPLVNATGVVIHTNLGRAPISKDFLLSAIDSVGGYCNLEYDLKMGKRGDRYGHLTALASFLFGCEDILLVNNNAAAVFLILNTLSNKKETVVSRGELVEIGGGFRIPEVMASSGAKLIEIGTTNKTRIADYEKAISEKSSILMKVHRSNFVIKGFSEEAQYGQIVELAKQKGLVDYYDIGSANSSSLKKDALANEADIFEIMKLSPSIVSFSADKLFGGLQAGIILGKKELIAKLKKNQLLRMFRCDKLTLAITERTMLEYAFGNEKNIAAIGMLGKDSSCLTKKAENIISKLNNKEAFCIVKTTGFVGGGSLPEEQMPSIAIAINSKLKPEKIEKILREKGVIARIEDNKLVLDMRTILKEDEERLIGVLNGVNIG